MNLFRFVPERLRRRMFRYTPAGFPDPQSCGTFYDVRHTVFPGNEMMILEYSGRAAQQCLFARATRLLAPQGRVLDLGCGLGHLVDYFDEEGHPYETYHGIDVSARMVEAARRSHAGDDAVLFEHRDILARPLERDDFDTGYILSVLGYPIGNDPMKAMMAIIEGTLSACRVGIVFSHLAAGRKQGLRFTTVPEEVAARCEKASHVTAQIDDDGVDFTYLLALRHAAGGLADPD